MKVHEIMTEPVITVSKYMTLEEVAHIMLNSKVVSLPDVANVCKILVMFTESNFSAK